MQTLAPRIIHEDATLTIVSLEEGQATVEEYNPSDWYLPDDGQEGEGRRGGEGGGRGGVEGGGGGERKG